MSSLNRVDLSSLPFPNVLEQLDFEDELQQCKNDILARDPELAEALNFEVNRLLNCSKHSPIAFCSKLAKSMLNPKPSCWPMQQDRI